MFSYVLTLKKCELCEVGSQHLQLLFGVYVEYTGRPMDPRWPVGR